ncbi:unnamed protein product [Adineta ricciae]|uniref:Uncharacterized protein n=1 Tax=Adineta ricciae TaxID=249248 RepID=A0A815JFF6_ADIRI|nr:unnamed protein product [Adineta ricciae]
MDYLRRLKRHFYTLNLFESINSHNNEFHASTERLSTRIYLIILFISLSACTIYFSLNIETKTFIVDRPTQETFERLQEKYSSTLFCPCSTNIIPYREFLSVSPVYHEVCSSVFISDEWLTSLFNINRTRYYQLDFRASSVSLFQLLRAFCEWNKHNKEFLLAQFEATLFLSRSVKPPEYIFDAAQSIFDDFERFVEKPHVQLPYIILESMTANQLVPAVQTSGVLKIDDIGQIYLSNGLWAGQCWCPQYVYCQDDARLYDDLFSFQSDGIYDNILSSYAEIPGFITGCNVLNSLLNSKLECLYNQTCISLMEWRNNSYYEALVSDENVSMVSPISDLVVTVRYFTRYWQKTTRYSDYYRGCSPSNCQYSVEQRADSLYILTNIFSVYGGLIMVYGIAIPMMVAKVRMWWTRPDAQRAAVAEQEEVINIRARLFRFWRLIRSTLLELNVFGGIIPSDDPDEIQKERLATRIYVLLFILICLPLILVNLLILQLCVETVENPTETVFERLYSRYNHSLQCSCTNDKIAYVDFSSSPFKMHAVCNGSYFIDPQWFANFPLTIKYQFAVLSSICARSETAVALAGISFSSLNLLADHAMSRELHDARIRATHHQLQVQTKTEILTPFQLNRILIHADKLMRRSDIQIYQSSGQIEAVFNSYDNGTCNCALTSKCIREVVLSFYIGCYPIDAMLQSTFECFYNINCMSLLESFSSEPNYNIQVLNSNQSRFLPNTTIESMLNELMLEQWDIQINYTKYYIECNPKNCTYSYLREADLISVVVLLLGFFSGLNIGLKISVPVFVKTILYYIIHRRIHFDLKAMFLSWNTFPTYASRRGDIRRSNTEKLATRIYAIVFILCFSSLVIYKMIKAPIKTDIVYNPTQATFEQLHKLYGTMMKCPCKEFSITYGSFLSILLVFHQVCSSYLTSSSWLSFLFESMNSTNNHLFILSQFQFLSYVCHISHSFAFDAILAFTNDPFISPEIVAESTLNSEISSLMSRFLFTTSKSVSECIEFMQELTHGSGIISMLYTNWKLTLSDKDNTTLFTDPVSYGNCSCGMYSSCTALTMIPGLRIGCYPSTAMMQSTLECFYNETCISMFFGAKRWPSLPIDNRSRFSPFHTVKSIIDQLMIEKWINTTNYTLYYEKCAPTSCSYSYSERFSLIYIVTMLTSLYGGLTMVLRFTVYHFVTHIRTVCRRPIRVGVNISS